MKITQKTIADKIQEKGAIRPCHRCGHNNFTLLDNIAKISVQPPDVKGLIFGGAHVPTAMIACTNCGAITYHALNVLGLYTNGEGPNDRE